MLLPEKGARRITKYVTALHTSKYEAVHAVTLLHTKLRKWYMRHVVIHGTLGGISKPRYTAIGFLNPRWWAEEFHDVDELLRTDKSRPMGKTFTEANLAVFQNRLLVLPVPSWVLPRQLRQEVTDSPQGSWCLEYYMFMADSSTDGLRPYSAILEVCPTPHVLVPRKWLGLQSVWRVAGRNDAFTAYMTTTQKPKGLVDMLLLFAARLLGAVVAVAGILGAYPGVLRARKKEVALSE
ncbi:MAG TPA: hypothetical protein VK502_01090 [Candidatus Saccharimonadales bacterium]|nr:hypothetical protein [Candidatus Saccharimonadales bacterium]